MKIERLIVVLIIGLIGTWAVADEIIRIAFEDIAQPPYFLGEGPALATPNPGISVEIVEAAAKQMSMRPVFVRMPWLRCLEDLQQGRVDAIFNASFSPERLKYGLYPGGGGPPDHQFRIASQSYSFVARKDSPTQWDGSQLLSDVSAVGVVHGFSVTGNIEELGRALGIKVIEAGSTEQALRMLTANRVSLVALQTLVAERYLKTSAYSDLRLVDPPIVTKDYFVMLSRNYVNANPARAEAFWKAIGQLRNRVEAQSVAKYGNP